LNPVEKALWYVESHFGQSLSLDEIAGAGGVSRHHMVRAFGAVTGRSVMAYVRGRRLSVAARSLAAGAPDILSVALDAGYDSHEAFTRAFRDQFGQTPEQVRSGACLDHLKLVEPLRMTQALTDISPPRFETSKPMLIAGLSERYNQQTTAGIPAQWQRFQPWLGHVPGQVGEVAYGVCYNGDGEGNIDYMSGVEVSDFGDLPPELSKVRLSGQTYAVFTHKGHVGDVHHTWMTIWSRWFPDSGKAHADAPDFERYGPEFDPRTGLGGFEIWVPIK
jgi:AraC family transcriptional regulator